MQPPGRRLALLLLLALACSGGAEPSSAPASAAESAAAGLRLAGTPLPDAPPKPDFVLTDTEGRPYDFRAETEGRLALLFFGYTSCPDICPVHLANLAAALDRIEPELARRVRVVFVGVDPERDTPARMRDWLDQFDRSFVGLTGSAEALVVAQQAADIPLATRDEPDAAGGYGVSHAAWITLYTPDGRARLRYPFGTRQREWAHDLRVLARDGWPSA